MLNSFFLKYKAHLQMHFIVLIWGFTGILGKLISVSSIPLVWYRMLIACAGLGAFLYFMRHKLELPKKEFLKIFTTGLIIAAHWSLFFEALKVSNVSVTLACLSSASLFTALLEPLFFRRRIIWYEIMFGFMVIVGLYLIFQFETQYILGITYSLISAFFAALFTVINGKFILKHSSKTISFYEMLGGFTGITIYFLLTSGLSPAGFAISMTDLYYLLILGLICTAYAFVVSVEVMKELSPYTVAVSVNMEPVYAIILALLFFGEAERMTAGFYMGALLILLTVITNAILKSRKRIQLR